MHEKAYEQDHGVPSESSLPTSEHDKEDGPIHIDPLSGEPLSKTHSKTHEGGVLARTLSRIRTRDSIEPIPPPPDGGTKAWMQVLLCHLVIFK